MRNGGSTETWVLASGNTHKIAELEGPLSLLEKKIRPQSDWQISDIDETGLSFYENAILKARHAARESGLSAIADDSGLIVDMLDGEPGLYSARYAGVHGDDAANRKKLLENVRSVPAAQRHAAFVCVLAMVRHAEDPLPLIALGRWPGIIADEERGEHGFGYDSIFIPLGHVITAAQMKPDEKAAQSHRARAIAQLTAQVSVLRAHR